MDAVIFDDEYKRTEAYLCPIFLGLVGETTVKWYYRNMRTNQDTYLSFCGFSGTSEEL